MKKTKYVIFGSRFEYYQAMFQENTNYQYNFGRLKQKLKKNFVLRFLYYFTTNKLGSRLSDRFQNSWKLLEFKKNNLDKKNLMFLFLQTGDYAHDYSFISLLKKKYPQAKFVIWLTNTVDAYNEDFNKLRETYDLIVTFNKPDALRNGLYFHDWCFSKDETVEKIKNDVFFSGYDKGRGNKIINVAEYLLKNGLRIDFTIVNKSPETPVINGINYVDNPLGYGEVLKRSKQSSCILEIVSDPNKNSPTLRIAEAIACSKKLITNNKMIETSSIYNPKQMKVFDDIKSIDIAWIKDKNKSESSDPQSINPEKFLNDIYEKLKTID